MVSAQGGKSRIRRIVGGITSTRPGSDDFGARSCAAFAISLVLCWLLTIVTDQGAPGVTPEPGLIGPLLLIVVFLGICGTNLLGVLFAIAGIGKAIWEKRIPIYSIIGIILNAVPSGFLLAILLLRA